MLNCSEPISVSPGPKTERGDFCKLLGEKKRAECSRSRTKSSEAFTNGAVTLTLPGPLDMSNPSAKMSVKNGELIKRQKGCWNLLLVAPIASGPWAQRIRPNLVVKVDAGGRSVMSLPVIRKSETIGLALALRLTK